VAQFNNIGKMMASALAAVSLAIPSLRKLLSSFGNE